MKQNKAHNWILALAVPVFVACITSACGIGGATTAVAPPGPSIPQGSPQPIPSPSFSPSMKIQHVVIIIQENRSFDNLFNGFPGADTVQSGKMSDGSTVPLTPTSLRTSYDLRHRHLSWWSAYDNGKMDGFDIDRNPQNAPTLAYQYVQHTDTVPYWQLASKYTIADRMFQSNGSGSFTAHLYLVAGQSKQVIDNPNASIWGCDSPTGTTAPLVAPQGGDGPGIFPCLSIQTLADLMDAQGISWRYYAPSIGTSGEQWSAFDAISPVRFGPDWTGHVVSPESRVLQDVAAGQLAEVTWVVPTEANSDHPRTGSTTGPSWVASVVNAIGQSSYWNNTAIFVVWDDWGGWYDHVPPPQLDNMGLGFRVPLIVVSPYAKHGYVSHVQHEFGSILHFTEKNFGLQSLGQADARADDLSDCFDFTQSPTPLNIVHQSVPASYFLTHPAREQAPDDDL